MRQASHEDVRVRVVGFLSNIYREVVDELYNVAVRSEKYDEALRLSYLREVFSEVQLVPLIMPQEARVSGGKYRVDMLVGRGAVFEIKRDEGEFDEAVRKAATLYLRAPELAGVKYFVVTNYEKWSIYRVERRGSEAMLNPVREGATLADVRGVLKAILSGLTLRLPPSTEVVKTLFMPKDPKKGENLWVQKMRGVFTNLCRICRGRGCETECRLQPLATFYSAYKNIMKFLYGDADEEFFVDLFVRHTVMHMVVLASLATALGKEGDPVDMCSGVALDVDIALPYLNWWRLVFVESGFEDEKRIAEEVASEIVQRAGLVDWSSGGAEDVFRLLYEYLVDEATRRKIGEYYTPLWLVELGLREFELRGKTVVDPFCGSGTFLVTAFHKKIEEGESPEEAYKSLIGFDVNPLAVAVARAELVLAYRRQSGRDPPEPPRIYHVDALATWVTGRGFVPEAPRLREFAERLTQLVKFEEVQVSNLQHVVDVEKHLTEVLHRAYNMCKSQKRERDEQCIGSSIESSMRYKAERVGGPLRAVFQRMVEIGLHREFAKLVKEYGGNHVWGLVFASLHAPMAIQRMRPDVVATNPPWIHISEFKAPYSDKLRERLLELAKEARVKAAQVVSGSDVATAALAKAIETAREGVVFVMNREQAFHHGSSALAGIVATYAVLRKWSGALKLIDIDFDAFGHGVYPALVVAKRGQGAELYVAKVEGRVAKSSRLESVNIELRRLLMSYEDYIEPGLLYFSEEETTENIAIKLDVDTVIRKGQFIMGLRGGERRRGEETYAGSTLEFFEDKGDKLIIKLYNMARPLEAPKELLEKYGIGIYNVIYVGEIYPFYVRRLYQVLLSSRGDEGLRGFLMEVERYNSHKLRRDDINKLRRLIEEVKQGGVPRTFTPGKFYVVYRADRAFTASAVKSGERYVLDSHASAIECKSEEQAHYYAAVLNYLVYKVKDGGRVFNHHQFAKPLQAIILLGLSWKDVPEGVRKEVARLAKGLPGRLPRDRKFSNKVQALEYVARYAEFRQIVRLLDGVAKKENWELALDLVSARNS